METYFPIETILPYEINVISAKEDRFVVQAATSKPKLGSNMTYQKSEEERKDEQDKIRMIIDEMGQASADAQDLFRPVTTSRGLLMSKHKLYVLRSCKKPTNKILGILQVGWKEVFLMDEKDYKFPWDMFCVFDFYVHQEVQRIGFGFLLFQGMLNDLKKAPVELAYDRPSDKFVSFLKRYYGLVEPLHLPSCYVVFPGIYEIVFEGGCKENEYLSPATEKQPAVCSSGTLVSVAQESGPSSSGTSKQLNNSKVASEQGLSGQLESRIQNTQKNHHHQRTKMISVL